MATSPRTDITQYRPKPSNEKAECPECGRECTILIDRFNGKTLSNHNEARVRRNKKVKLGVQPLIYATKTRCSGSGRFMGRVSNER